MLGNVCKGKVTLVWVTIVKVSFVYRETLPVSRGKSK